MTLTATKVPQQVKKVQAALDIATARWKAAADRDKPRAHAKVAILTADMNDRRMGITQETALEDNLEYTPGLILALDILGGRA